LQKWSIREYKSDDAQAVRELFAEVHNSTRPIEHFIWKFHKDPAGQGITMIAEDSGKIVGQFALMPTWLKLGNKVVLGAQLLDLMTHPNYRNQGIFTLLAKTCIELATKRGVEMLYGFPNTNSYHCFLQKLNWDHVSNIPKWARVLSSKALKSYSSPIRQIASLGIPLLPIGKSKIRGIEIRMGAPGEDEVASLSNSMSLDNESGICRIERSNAWIKWRFDSSSQTRYVWFSAYQGGKLKACAVFGINDWEQTPLIDVMGSDIKPLEAVLSNATSYAKQLGFPAVVAVTNFENIRRALKSCGYFQHGNLPLIVRSLTSRNLGGNIHLHCSWRIASADLDIF
jgi:GNAT superfamily N-acetyltransferase